MKKGDYMKASMVCVLSTSAMKSRDLLAIEPSLMNGKVMQKLLECTIYAGALSQSFKTLEGPSPGPPS